MNSELITALLLCGILFTFSCNGSHSTKETLKGQTPQNGSYINNILAEKSAEKSETGQADINATLVTVQSKIEAANKAGKVVFLIVTDPGVVHIAKAETTAQQAQKLHRKSVVIKMNRSDPDNKKLVDKYRLRTAPLPLILVVSTNGIITGGYALNQATPKRLVALIPSPKKAEVIQAISQGKSVFIVVSKKSMLKKKDVLSKCELACAEMKNKAKVVEIDLDDTKEKRFLNELKVNQTAAQPQTYVINTKGQVTGSLSGVVDSETLVATATKKISSGCCPPGSNKSCGPPKKK